MPIYEYNCTNCHHFFDLLQKINDEPEKTCPACLKETAQRLVSAAAFQLKGTGWYATDFKDKGAKAATASTKSTSSSEIKESNKKVTEASATGNATTSKGESD